MEDTFIKLAGSRPNYPTIHPNRDIDFILTYGIQLESILTLRQNHLATYNQWKNTYSMYQNKSRHIKMIEKIDALLDKAIKNPSDFSPHDATHLNDIDFQLTQIMLTGERKCSNR